MAALSLVCQYFRVACQPRLFKRIVVKLKERADTPDPRELWWTLLQAGDKRSRGVASRVESCTIDGTFDPSSRSFVDSYYDVTPPSTTFLEPVGSAMIRALPHFNNMASFSFSNHFISTALIRAISDLPVLKSVELVNCPGDRSRAGMAPLRSAKGKWTSLRVQRCSGKQGDKLQAFIPSLAQLVNRASLRVLVTDDLALVDALFAAEELLEIEQLDLTLGPSRDFGSIVCHLQRCPQLETLALRSVSTKGWNDRQILPDTALRCLRSFSGDVRTAQQVIGSRPIVTLTILEAAHTSFSPKNNSPIPTSTSWLPSATSLSAKSCW